MFALKSGPSASVDLIPFIGSVKGEFDRGTAIAL
jgi:hypothetical protein